MTASIAQSRVNWPAFDVASVKPNNTGLNSGSISRSGGRITLDNVSLRECVMFAYSIPLGREYELVGPGWLEAEKFDIAATFPPATSRGLVRDMVRNLLAERFGLKVHRESRNLKAYALVKARGGPKLTQSVSGDNDDDSFTFREGHVTVRAMSMASFADRLSGSAFHLDRPVVDRTGIVGAYDFTLEWAPNGLSVDERPGASLFTAIQEQLGLKIDAQRIAASILVVDQINKVPSSN